MGASSYFLCCSAIPYTPVGDAEVTWLYIGNDASKKCQTTQSYPFAASGPSLADGAPNKESMACCPITPVLVKESVAFHETMIQMDVNLADEVELVAGSVRVDADEATADLAGAMQAWFCVPNPDGTYREIPPPVLSQGDILSFCTSVVESKRRTFVWSTWKKLIWINQEAHGCGHKLHHHGSHPQQGSANGICFVQTLVPSRYFQDRSPSLLDISGLGLLAFGAQPE